MLNYRQHIFTQMVAIVLACAFTLAPAASHVHLEEHGLDREQSCTHCSAPDESACACCQTNTDCQQQSDHDNDQPHHKCYCSCFINLLSILPELEFQNDLSQEPFYLAEFQINIIPVIQNIYRPPRS